MRLAAGILADMYQHFRPYQGEDRPCWHCTQFIELVAGGTAARCTSGGIRALPMRGCAFWEREPGADDEPEAAPSRPVTR